jgi:hypothetical protein
MRIARDAGMLAAMSITDRPLRVTGATYNPAHHGGRFATPS